ncbi:M48 family metallopeptidase [Plebeiibacterium sediminum]|uniref:M48 family metallopeptidase n=1 Tax=Plebeiibacterium sediminum TaxID=2992112 RepID=A0AAE3SG88_9BACT|nr:M48 family metallopeptidase [Plebeiobacterium sediminum]MCW3788250.1 M48 family metallopeptidase [Plebeiobacterium sediminum]
MNNRLNYKVSSKEGFYFGIKLLVSMAAYAALILLFVKGSPIPISTHTITIIVLYAVLIVFALLFRMGILVGYLRGNSIKLTQSQFPDIYKIVVEQCEKIGLKRIPDVFLLQAGGLLNAFATRFMGRNYIVIYSDVLEEAYEKNLASVEFIIGHELGHIKRKHLQKRLFLFPSFIIPFLNQAYSRACEYTCDNIGASLSPDGVVNGLVLLSSGKKLYGRVDVKNFVEQGKTHRGFWVWFAEKISTHPNLTKRIAKFPMHTTTKSQPVIHEQKVKEFSSGDHSKYMPQL